MSYTPKNPQMSAPTSAGILKKINTVPTQMPQAPNRKGNVSVMTPSSNTGVTVVTGSNKRGVSQPSGSQGAPKAGGKPNPSYCGPVSVSRPKSNYGVNDGYRAGSGYDK